jgi:hypothetical protein
MEYAVIVGGHQLGYFPGQVQGVSGGKDLVIDHPEFMALFSQLEHSLHEVAAFATGASHAEKARRPDDEVPETKMAGKIFPSQLGSTISVQWNRRIEFGVGAGLVSVHFAGAHKGLSFAAEDIVSADVNQLGSRFLGNHSDIAGSQGIHREGFVMFILAVINSNKGSRIDNDGWLILAERLLYRIHVADFDVFMGERDKFEISKDFTKVGA